MLGAGFVVFCQPCGWKVKLMLGAGFVAFSHPAPPRLAHPTPIVRSPRSRFRKQFSILCCTRCKQGLKKNQEESKIEGMMERSET